MARNVGGGWQKADAGSWRQGKLWKRHTVRAARRHAKLALRVDTPAR
jgi:hypothetical protein